MRLYIFAIGGSGSRVIRSLTMLLASGVHADSNIVPIIIDPDTANGDLNRTTSALRQYEEVRNGLNFDNTLKNQFFSASITSFNNDGNYLLPLNGVSGITFDRYLNVGGMSQENQALAKMLFSNNNLSSTMDVGFKGNPNIGSIVLNQFTQSADFKNFEANFVDGDKVFIISSIFGGTGASGFPLILKTLRTGNNSALAKAPIGAVSLLPYFNLKTNEKSSIQADSFVTKAKSALHYYEKNVTGNSTLNDMYYLGDDFSGQTYDNCDGGDNQSNDAHVIELLGALAVLDFDKKQHSGQTSGTLFHEFGLSANPTGSILFTDIGNNTNAVIKKPLSMMAIMNSYLNNRSVSHRVVQRWAKDRKALLGLSFFNGKFYSSYEKFKSMFEEWITEMERNDKSFAPFNNDTEKTLDGLEKIKGTKPAYSGIPFFKKKGYDLIDELLGKNLSSIHKNIGAASTFMELFHKTLSDICKKNLNIQ